VTATNNLGLKLLADYAANDSLMARQHMHLIPGPDIPDSNRRIPASSENKIQSGMLGDAVHSRQVAMVVSDYLVVFEVPAFYGLVFRHGVKIRIFTRLYKDLLGDDQPSNGVDVPGQRDLQITARHVPELDRPVIAAGNKPLPITTILPSYWGLPPKPSPNPDGHLSLALVSTKGGIRVLLVSSSCSALSSRWICCRKCPEPWN